MRFRWRHVRWAFASLASLIITVAIVPPAGQFFISLAEERGLYAHPSASVSVMTDWLVPLTASPWFHWIGGGVVGFTIGVRLDALFKRQSQPPALRQVDRDALAAEAISLADNIAQLVGDYIARDHVASQQRSVIGVGSHDEAARVLRNAMAAKAEAEGRFIEKYYEKYHSDVWRVISMAQKCIKLDYGQVWHISHRIGNLDIPLLPKLLMQIAVGLRHTQADVPMTNPLQMFKATNPPESTPQSQAR